jgi:putative ABC transport system permease protein
MSWIDAGRHFLRTVFRRERLERELDEEIRFHLELEAMQQQAAVASSGVERRESPELAARRRFGHVETIREERRLATGLALLDQLQQDAHHAIRQLTRAPGFAAGIALTLALGVGANATMFAVVDRIMLRAPQGIGDADRLVQFSSIRELRDGSRDTSTAYSYASYLEFRALSKEFERVTAIRGPIDIAVDRGVAAVNVRGALVGDDYFTTLAVRPALGRFFAIDETRPPSGAAVAVISHGLWRSRYGAEPDVLGRSIEAGGVHYTIVGVAPRGFTGHTLDRVELWLPIAAAPNLRSGGADWTGDRGTRWLHVVGRLNRGVSKERALAGVSSAWSAWNMRPGSAARGPTPDFLSLIPARNTQRPEYRVAALLAGVAVLLLVVTCANVANLLLSRALARRREVAVRLALGVSRIRLASLFVADAIVLALLGGAVAIAVAWAGVPLVRSILFAGGSTGEWTVDARVAAFSMIVALVAGLAAGIVPALQASRAQVFSALRRPHDSLLQHSRARRALLVAQAALTAALLAGTGLFARSLQRIGEREIGLDLDRIIVADFPERGTNYSPALVRELYAAMRERALHLPGVEGASLSVGVPFEGQYALPLAIPGRDSIPGMERGRAPFLYAVTPDFFQTMGTRVLAGRAFTPADDNTGAPSVAIVSAGMARLIWPNGDALGQCFKIELRSVTPNCTMVIGIAEDARRESITGAGERAQYYVPLAQAPAMMSELTLLVRAAAPRTLTPALAGVVQTLRADMPYVRIRNLEDAVAPELRPWRVGAAVFGLFGTLALIVAVIGTYSVIQFGVAQRRHELGVRAALGAPRRELIGMVIGEGLRIAAVASLAGVILVIATGPLIREHLFETSPRDPVVLSVVAIVLMTSAALATIAPAWSAGHADPLTALKAE